jgi:hypothetical protein
MYFSLQKEESPLTSQCMGNGSAHGVRNLEGNLSQPLVMGSEQLLNCPPCQFPNQQNGKNMPAL